jgi:WD40 repeat protein
MNTFKAHSKPIYSLAFSPDGRRLLSSGGDKKVLLWSLDTPTREQEWPGSQIMAPVAFSPDGHYIGSGGYGIRVWQVGVTRPPLVDSKEWAASCRFSPDGRVFAAFGAERAIMRWAIPGGAPLQGGWGGTRASNGNERFPVGGMTFHPGGTIIANCYGVLGQCGFHPVIHLWDAASGTPVKTLEMTFSYAYPMTLAFSPDGALLVADTGPILHVWDHCRSTEIASLCVGKKYFKGFSFTGDGHRLLAVNHENVLCCWNTLNWNRCPITHPSIGKLTALAVCADGRVAVGSSSGDVMILQSLPERPS